jgi:hypothetical protein
MTRRIRRESVIVHVSGEAAAVELERRRQRRTRAWGAVVGGVLLLAALGQCTGTGSGTGSHHGGPDRPASVTATAGGAR